MRKITEGSGCFSPTPHPEERSDEGSHEILQPFGLQDDQSGKNAKNSPTGQITYKKAGVNIDAANSFVEAIKPLTKNIGGFGGLVKFDKKKYKEPYLIAATDGVGTKLKIAFLVGKHNTVGIDLVAMSVNDILCSGAKPLFFLDYIATGKLEKKALVDVVKGIAAGCRQAGCALIGGETAELPGFYKKGEYDLAGFCVGAVEGSRIIDGSKVKPGDLIIGLASNGLHSNGYSLVNKIFTKTELKKRAKEFLKPTKIYVKPVLSLLSNNATNATNAINAISHITGGGFYDNIPRILPKGTAALIYKQTWPIPRIFKEIQTRANLPDKEMFRTFNMGIGMVLIAKDTAAKNIIARLKKSGVDAFLIGKVIKGGKEVLL